VPTGAENGFGAASRAVLVERHTSELPQSVAIVAHGGLEVCDGAHRCFVMKKLHVRFAGVGTPMAPGKCHGAITRPPILREKHAKDGAPTVRLCRRKAGPPPNTTDRHRAVPEIEAPVLMLFVWMLFGLGEVGCSNAPNLFAFRCCEQMSGLAGISF